MRAELDRPVGSGFPFTEGFKIFGDFIARRRLVEGEQMAAVLDDIDEGTVLERAGVADRPDKCRIDRYGIQEAAIDGTARAAFGGKGMGINETIAVTRPTVGEID